VADARSNGTFRTDVTASRANSRATPFRKPALSSTTITTVCCAAISVFRPQRRPPSFEKCLKHALQKAGAAKLMTPELIATLCDHAQGNLHALMSLSGEMLAVATQREARLSRSTRSLLVCAQGGGNP